MKKPTEAQLQLIQRLMRESPKLKMYKELSNNEIGRIRDRVLNPPKQPLDTA